MIAVETESDNTTVTATPPRLAYGSLAPLTHREVMLFGGDGSPDVPVQTGNDSAYTFQLIQASSNVTTARWTAVPKSWAPPMRRVYQGVESDEKGGVWVIGGAKADGSGIGLREAWALNTSTDTPQFHQLTPPPGDIVGATSTLLSDGSLLMLGGQDTAGQLQSFQTVYALNTKTNQWSATNTTGVSLSASASEKVAIPLPRRNHVAVSLPSKRVFLHGGSADNGLTSALSDAWILDWSVSPPVWSQLDANASGAPSARFGHSAVAYGRKVALTLGWTGTAAADSAVYIFDATSLVSARTTGGWSGGHWTTTYEPDTSASPGRSSSSSSSGSSQSGVSTTQGNGSSTSSGGQISSFDSANNSSAISSSTSSPFQPSSADSKSKDHDSSKATKASVKAGAVVGALVGCGLVFAAGYFLYQRHQDTQLRIYRSGDEERDLLGGGGVTDGQVYPFAGFGPSRQSNDKHPQGEKSWLAHTPGNRPAGPRPYERAKNEVGVSAAFFASPNHEQDRGLGWSGQSEGMTSRTLRRDQALSPSNMGHAKEGSGPRMRQRLALLTGLTSWGTAEGPRFDMLADEDEDQLSSMALNNRGRLRAHDKSEDVNEGDDDEAGLRVLGKGYGPLTVADPEGDEEGAEDGESFEYNAEQTHDLSQDQPYLTSPFEDEDQAWSRNLGRAGAAGSLAALGGLVYGSKGRSTGRTSLQTDLSDEDWNSPSRRSADSRNLGGTPSGPSSHSHRSRYSLGYSGLNHTFSSKSSSSHDPRVLSDMCHHDGTKRGSLGRSTFSHRRYPQNPLLPSGLGLSDGSGSLMKRSPTWWNRFVSGTGLLERTASGRTAPSSRTVEPIRDTAPAPDLVLSVIKENPRSADHSEDNPLADVLRYADEPEVTKHESIRDEVGRKRPRPDVGSTANAEMWQHNRSWSSLQSARTGTSSHLEARLRDMDVVQRTRTGSSRGTASTRCTNFSSSSSNSKRTRTGRASQGSDSTSNGPLSRMDSISEADLSPQQYDSDFTPGQVVWRGPGDWEQMQSVEDDPHPQNGSGLFEGSVAEDELPSDGDESMDITSQIQRIQSSKAKASKNLISIAEDSETATEFSRHHLGERSEVPSITPATTKRARENPKLTRPIREAPPHSPGNAQLRGVRFATVRERVEAIERLGVSTNLGEDISSEASVSGSMGGNFPAATPEAKAKSSQGLEARHKRGPAADVSHGLVPKPQLFVANPDSL